LVRLALRLIVEEALDGEVSGSTGEVSGSTRAPERNERGVGTSARGLQHLRFIAPVLALASQSASTSHDKGRIDHLQT
jgi:hypothetical protein